MVERDGLTLSSRSCSEMPDCRTPTATITQQQPWLSLIFSDYLRISEAVGCFITTCPLPERCWIAIVDKRLLPASQHTTHDLCNTKQACIGAQKAWVCAQYFMKSRILVSIHPLFLETTRDYSETATRPPSSLYSLLVCHSRPPSYSRVNGLFPQGSTTAQTYPLVTSAGQKAFFSEGFAIRPETKKA